MNRFTRIVTRNTSLLNKFRINNSKIPIHKTFSGFKHQNMIHTMISPKVIRWRTNHLITSGSIYIDNEFSTLRKIDAKELEVCKLQTLNRKIVLPKEYWKNYQCQECKTISGTLKVKYPFELLYFSHRFDCSNKIPKE